MNLSSATKGARILQWYFESNETIYSDENFVAIYEKAELALQQLGIQLKPSKLSLYIDVVELRDVLN